jgi:hypothetical protein
MVVPRFVKAALNNEPITIYGDGSQLICVVATNWAGGNVTNPSTFSQITVTGNTFLNTLTANTLTVTGNTFLNVVTATTISGVTTLRSNTISATTYQNLPADITITGGTYSASVSTIIFTNNTGGTFTVTGITATGGGGSGSFTGGTVTGATIFTNGVTANTVNISSLQSGIFLSSLGIDSAGRIVSGQTTSNFTGGTVTGATIYTGGLTANTISATTITATNYNNLPVTGLTAGYNVTITQNYLGGWEIAQNAGSAVNITGGTYYPVENKIIFSSNTGLIPVSGITVYTDRRSDYVYPFQYSGSAPYGTSVDSTNWVIRRIAFSSATPTITQAKSGNNDKAAII